MKIATHANASAMFAICFINQLDEVVDENQVRLEADGEGRITLDKDRGITTTHVGDLDVVGTGAVLKDCIHHGTYYSHSAIEVNKKERPLPKPFCMNYLEQLL